MDAINTIFINENLIEKPGPYPGTSDSSHITDAFRADVKNFWTAHEFHKTPYVIFPVAIPNPMKLVEQPVEHVGYAKEKSLGFNSTDLELEVRLQEIGYDAQGPWDQKPSGKGPVSRTQRFAVYIDNYNEKKESLENNGTIPKDGNWWTDWVTNKFGDNNVNHDHVFAMPTPNPPGLESNRIAEVTNNFVHLNANYNYYNEDYENIELIPPVKETLLPHLYTYMAVVENNMDMIKANSYSVLPPGWAVMSDSINRFKRHLTMDGLMRSVDTNSLFYKQESKATHNIPTKFSLGNSTINNYFNLWTETFNRRASISSTSEQNIENATFGFENIIVAEEDLRTIVDYSGAESSFPMSVSIKIKSERGKSVFSALKETHFYPYAINFLLGNFPDRTTFVSSKGGLPLEDKFVEEWSLDDFVASPEVLMKNYTNNIFLGNQKNPTMLALNDNSIFSQLMTMAFKTKIQDLKRSTSRSFQEILSGEAAYSETLIYEVEKWTVSADDTPAVKLQSFFLPNSPKEFLEYIDTQVMYNKNYIYKIFAYKVVFGTKYSYSLNKTIVDNDSNKLAVVDVVTDPDVKVYKVSYYNADDPDAAHIVTKVLDEPPLAPEIEIVPIIREPKNIIINIKDTIGSVYDFAHIINTQDEDLFYNILKKQMQEEYNLSLDQTKELSLENEKILFKSDEPSQFMQVFGLTTKPTSYEDFADSQLSLEHGPNPSLKLQLDYNKKYYFTFRAIDFHGKFSNPTDVYEVEIKHESGMSFPIMRAFKPHEENKRDQEKRQKQEKHSLTGKRFIYIKPCYQQWIMKEKYEEADFYPLSAFDLKDFSLGDAAESVFQENKKFKMRLKSKKTGRIIDINFQCKHKEEKIIKQ